MECEKAHGKKICLKFLNHIKSGSWLLFAPTWKSHENGNDLHQLQKVFFANVLVAVFPKVYFLKKLANFFHQNIFVFCQAVMGAQKNLEVCKEKLFQVDQIRIKIWLFLRNNQGSMWQTFFYFKPQTGNAVFYKKIKLEEQSWFFSLT